ncbi:MAG TPA: enoyl-CoA hydratase-related protein [Verrucomicrobiae bacterium]|nr:enoyl-CoA hydratase-related protein [Verrucomicrobiae bacterium]
MEYSTLNFQDDGHGIVTVTLDVPEKRNAISSQMIGELLDALENAEKGSSRVVILSGSGKAFCAGMDLSELQNLAKETPEKNIEDARRLSKMLYRLYSFPKPVIAAVNGPAIAGGSMLATLTDFTLAVPEAKFGYPEVKLGFMPALVVVFLRRQVADRAARALLLTGRIIDAAEASRIGLVAEIVPPEKLMERAHKIAAELMAASPTSIARTKKFILGFDDAALQAELEQAVNANADIRSTPDFKEGIASFLEKRSPKWTAE